ncbi:MAG: hypothetical protein WC179_09230 [Candidatus Cloacimonadaceae bacterium]
MNKYHVKFTHKYIRPQDTTVNSVSAIQYITETVDAEWEFNVWVDVFTYIYAHYEVIGCVEVIHINTNESFKEEK